MTDLEKQISDALKQTCGCIDGPFEEWDEDRTVRMYPGGPRALLNCPECLPKRIAAAIEATALATPNGYHGAAHCNGCASEAPAIYSMALRALKGEP